MIKEIWHCTNHVSTGDSYVIYNYEGFAQKQYGLTEYIIGNKRNLVPLFLKEYLPNCNWRLIRVEDDKEIQYRKGQQTIETF